MVNPKRDVSASVYEVRFVQKGRGLAIERKHVHVLDHEGHG